MPLRQLPWFKQQPALQKDGLEQASPAQSICIAGPKGIGKTHELMQRASWLMCSTHNACGQCQNCQLLARGEHSDVVLVQPQPSKAGARASTGQTTSKIGIDSIRQLIEFSRTTPFIGQYRIIILQPLEALTLAASNALLKVLEEPPKHLVILSASSAPSRLMPTIRSRLHFINVMQIQTSAAQSWLGSLVALIQTTKIEFKPTPEQVQLALQIAYGGPLKALEILLVHHNITDKKADKIAVLCGLPTLSVPAKAPDILQHLIDFKASSAPLIQHDLPLDIFINCLEIELIEQLKPLEALATNMQDDKQHNQKIACLYQAFESLYSVQEKLNRSPQLNASYVKLQLNSIYQLLIA